MPSVKPIGLYLPHEWFAWLSTNEQAAGFQELESFWGSHSMEDPKLDGNPAMHESWQHVFGTCLNPFQVMSNMQHSGGVWQILAIDATWRWWCFSKS